MNTKLPSKDLVLIGAGHTNSHIIKMWRMQPIPDVKLTVVSPFSRATYSGMLPGTLAGLYTPDEMEIDLYRLCVSCGAKLIVAEATGLDPTRRRILFENRPPIRYDVCSIGIGSVPSRDEVWQDQPAVLSIKPMATFLQRFESQLNLAFEKDSSHPPSICVVGGGAAGVEVTFCVDSLLKNRGLKAQLSLIDSGRDILNGYLPKGVRFARNEFARREITIHTEEIAENYVDQQLILQSGNTLSADIVIWATKASPPPVLENFDLPKADDGFLAVQQTLKTTANYPVFVVGDTATFVEKPVPKAGVYAVREGKVLWENIQSTFQNEELIPYDPQSGFLSLLATGDGRAIGQYRGYSTHSHLAWKWKDHIDRKFMRMYQTYQPTSNEMMQQQDSSQQAPVMRCRGCGGKVGANVLSAALERLDVPANQHVLQGLDQADDAALLDPDAGTADVISVDFFHSFLDDPYIVGRVAALNSLSDIWAMGSQPVGAMAMVSLPEGEHRQQGELLYQLLAGGIHELAKANATLLGGHTTEGEDLTIGYTVIGKLDGLEPFTKGKLKSGDRLILTKPLGTGVLLAGLMECKTRAVWMDQMLVRMLESNQQASHVAREWNATGVTDVTGFGLAGHLLEMLDASQLNATISLEALPILEGFSSLSKEGIRSTLDPANRETEDRIAVSTNEIRDDSAYNALFDPQTSGGLLIAISADKADGMIEQLKKVGYPHSAVIGEVGQSSQTPILNIVTRA